MAHSNHQIIIIGSGFSGIGMGIKLKQAGINDFIILERAADVGGTWRDNQYPGCACDVQSHLYSFSFEPNPTWSRKYSPSPEIHEYIRHCARKYSIYPHIKFNTKLTGGEFNESTGEWTIYDENGNTYSSQFAITAVGPLSNPAMPKIKGIEKFEGKTFHSATWDHDYDLKGKRVAVVGTGASAIQFVPEIAKEVEELNLFQRTPPWIMPKPDRPFTEREKNLFKFVPFYAKAHRYSIYWMNELFLNVFLNKDSRYYKWGVDLSKGYLKKKIKDPVLREKVTPKYQMGCKRILVTNNYYPALARDNVDVVTDAITEVTKDSVVTANGDKYKVDAIIYGTGFQVTEPLMGITVKGLNGVDLNDKWKENGFENYYGTAISGFPNMYTLAGPNTGIGHTSLVFMIESQINLILDIIKKAKKDNLKYVDVRETVQQHHSDIVQGKMDGTAWTSGCNSWYLSEQGKNFTIWPDFTFKYWNDLRKMKVSDYDLVPQEAKASKAQAV